MSSNEELIKLLCFDFGSKHIYFELAQDQNPSTWIINVITDDGEDIDLGQIKWYAQWRQYAFYPNSETVYEKTCLKDITEFVKLMNKQQKKGIKPTNPQKKLELEEFLKSRKK